MHSQRFRFEQFQLGQISSTDQIMAATALTTAEISAAFDIAQADLRFLMDREEVDEQIQAQLYTAGVRTVKQLSALVADAASLRTPLGEEPFFMTPTGLTNRAKLARAQVA